jgi:hypothetical protein
LHNAGLLRIGCGQTAQGIVQGQHIDVWVHYYARIRRQGPNPFRRIAAPRMIDQNAPHYLCRHNIEMRLSNFGCR